MNRSTFRIGIISDTHGLMRPEALEAFAHVDHILHAGDIGSEGVLDALGALAPVTAVRGNVDVDLDPSRIADCGVRSDITGPPVRNPQPAIRDGDTPGYEIARLTLDGLNILLTHVLPRPQAPSDEVKASLARERADVVVFGHSHLPHDEKVGGVWFLNPASAGPRRFDYPVSVAILEKAKSGWIFCHVPLDSRSVTAIGDRMNQLR